MTNPSFFNEILIWPITNLLVAIYHVLNFVHMPYALGFSIIVLTIVIRIILYPLTNSQLKASRKMQELNPHISKLKEKHKNDAKTLQQETMKLYKEHGVNPAAGCLPVIIQLPIIWALYSVLQQIVNPNSGEVLKNINQIVYFGSLKLTHAWDPSFFGLPLGQNPAELMKTLGVIVLLVPIITAILQYIQSKMMFVAVPKKDNGEKKQEDFATTFQTQAMYIFPLMIGFFSYTFPIGLSLYWNTFTVFGIIQQYKISGLGGLASWKEKIYGKK